MTDTTTADPYAIELAKLADLLGALHDAQTDEVRRALADDREGVMAMAARIARTPGLNSPVGVFITRIRQREYHQHAAPSSSGRGLPDADEVLRRLYFAKLDALERMRWRTPGLREREALDYACSYLPSCQHAPMPEGGLLALEDELCLELGIDRHGGRR